MFEVVIDATLPDNSLPPPPDFVVVIVTAELVLNRHPLGAVRISVPVALKSLLAPSKIVIVPMLLKVGVAPFWARSAESPTPPPGAEMVTLAKVEFGAREARVKARTDRTTVRFMCS